MKSDTLIKFSLIILPKSSDRELSFIIQCGNFAGFIILVIFSVAQTIELWRIISFVCISYTSVTTFVNTRCYLVGIEVHGAFEMGGKKGKHVTTGDDHFKFQIKVKH